MFQARRVACLAAASALLCLPTLHADAQGGQAGIATCGIADLPGLSAQYGRALRADAPNGGPARALSAGAASDFWIVAASVLRLNGRGDARDARGRTVVDGVGLPSLSALPCDPDVRARDRTAWSMGMVGYSAREIADVVDGHLTIAALDQAYARAMIGQPRDRVAAFLDSQWREAPRESVASIAPLAPCSDPAGAPRRVIDDLAPDIIALAIRHRVAPALIRAVIAAESGGNPCAVSRAGAIGLMQLMPATAAALGVDPWKPLENLRGGIAYLASMLRTYGENARLALIAYNAGPQHADRVKAGRAVAYRETRRYLDAIAARYPL